MEPRTYDQALACLFSRTSTHKKDWSRTLELMRLFGDPHTSFRSVHVAGTNGKGSVSLKIARTLQHQGYRTGLFISPHIVDFCERISVNGELVSQDFVVETVGKMLKVVDKCEDMYHFFELTTVLGFLYFQQQAVDIVVVEVGIGGLRDTTNVITPEVSIITSIGFDHMNMLGNTLEEIAFQKAGIIKPGVPCVIGPNCPREVFEEQCRLKGSTLTEVPDMPEATYEVENNETAFAALRVLASRGFPVSPESLQSVISSHQPFRFQRNIVQGVEVVIDVGHNSTAVERFLGDIKKAFPNRPFQVIIGMSANKDVRAVLEIITQQATRISAFSIDHPRLLPSSDLFSLLSSVNPSKAALHGGKEVIATVLRSCAPGDLVLICGSCFIMAAVQEVLSTLDS